MTALRMTLLRTRDADMTAEQKELEYQRFCDESGAWFREMDEAEGAFDRLREVIAKGGDDLSISLVEATWAANYVEMNRYMTNVIIALGAANVERLKKRFGSGACAYCGWTFRDETLDWDVGVTITPEEMDAVNDRVTAQIREHVTVCERHPMRVLEMRLRGDAGEIEAFHRTIKEGCCTYCRSPIKLPGHTPGPERTDSGDGGDVSADAEAMTRAGLEPATYGLKGHGSNAGNGASEPGTTTSIDGESGEGARSGPENGTTSPEKSPDGDEGGSEGEPPSRENCGAGEAGGLLNVDELGAFTGPKVIRGGALDVQVCIPRSWTDAQVREFAERQNPSGTTNGWSIRRAGDPALNGMPERCECAARTGYVHMMLDA